MVEVRIIYRLLDNNDAMADMPLIIANKSIIQSHPNYVLFLLCSIYNR